MNAMGMRKQYKLRGIFVIRVKTDLVADEIPSAHTLKHLLEEDLKESTCEIKVTDLCSFSLEDMTR